MNKRLFFKFIFSCLFFFTGINAKNVTFTILTFNDFYTVSSNSEGKGGVAGMATLLQTQRAKSKYHITTVNGDFLFPSILSSYDKGAHRIELMNDLGVDLVVLGNHEFDFGIDVLKSRMAESNFSYLTANCFDLSNRPFTGDQQVFIVDVEGIKVGFFGLITVETPLLSSTEMKVNFTPVIYTAKQMVKQLKKSGADVIVALTHLFIDDDKKLAQEVPEIDLVLGGHDHDPMTWFDGKTLVHKSGQNAYFLTRVDLVIDKNELTSKVSCYPSWEVICNYRIPCDERIALKIAEYEKQFDVFAAEPIAKIIKKLDSTNPGVRSKEMTMGNLIADALRHSCGTQIAMICGGIIRGDHIYEPGTFLTLKDVLSELPFNNLNIAVEMTGKDILDALESSVLQLEGRAGRFLHVSGLKYAFDVKLKPGKRICAVKVNGEPLDLKALYSVATVDYLYNGGDGYSAFKKGRLLLDPLQHLETVGSVINYIKHLEEIAYGFEERIISYDCACSLDDTYIQQSGQGIGQ